MVGLKMNVLVYSGIGTTAESVRHVIYSLRRVLSPLYSVSPVTAEALIKEPWTNACVLIVVPGGADLGYCRSLNGPANRRITQFVRRGGAYLGFCAGGYFGTARVEFAVGDPKMEVLGNRELSFFPGPCRGPAFNGFRYASEVGARASVLKVEKQAFVDSAEGDIPEHFRSYFNGGGVFVDADSLGENVEVLARYTEDLDVDGGDAAVVFIKVGDGRVILTGPHPEFAGVNLDKNLGDRRYSEVVDAIIADHNQQVKFLQACFKKLGLKHSEQANVVPPLSVLHLTALYPEDVPDIITNLRDVMCQDGSDDMILGETDSFILQDPRRPTLSQETKWEKADRIIEYHEITKTLFVHDKGYPGSNDTPHFDHEVYYNALDDYRTSSRLSPSQLGSFIMYGEVLTSTSTILDSNFQLLQRLPNGLTTLATVQIAGRGRGSNTWVSPKGSLLFSTLLKHAASLGTQAPVVFVQYLAAMAIVEAAKTYEPGYGDVPVKLKWPNDIYAEDPKHVSTTNADKKYVKIGGILVTSTYANNEYILVVGCGINTSNSAPTTSLNLLVEKLNITRTAKGLSPLPLYEHEKLLARILVVFDEFYSRFSVSGFKIFEDKYYENWMHSDQIVRLEMEGGAKARIRGITTDQGLLRADELDREGHATGRVFTLQSDGNSFDFFNGLLKTKR
ncbi:biotin-protein ligase [Peziza echinospora]|nr:biotin-protein ligase [Peziza echinospora]